MRRIALACDRQNPSKSVFTYRQSYANEAYTNAILKAGGIPLLIPVCNEKRAKELLSGFDGLVIMGGNDICPRLYGEKTTYSIDVDESLDLFHLSLIKEAKSLGLPMLGICRGLQLLNVAYGGTLYQDIEKELSDKISHKVYDKPYEAVHNVELEKESALFSIMKTSKLGVNSLHHQGIKTLGKGLAIAAKAEDGLIEAIEGEKLLAVQWHPEAMKEMDSVFSYFIEMTN